MNRAGVELAIYKKGADTAVLRAVAERMTSYGQQLDGVATDADRAVTSLKAVWGGGDLDQFVTGWGPARAGLATCRDTLTQLSQAILRNAGQQDDTSGGGGATGPLHSPEGRDGVGSGSGDKNKDPKHGDLGPDVHAPNIPMSDSDLEMSDIEQGHVADCWLMAGLGAVAQNDPQFIRDHVKYDAATNTYTVTLYDDGEPVEVKVKGDFPEGGAHNAASGQPNFASIYEKAMAQFMGGSYSDIEYDNATTALEAITGREAEDHGEIGLDEIEQGIKDGRIYTIDSEDKDAFWWWDDQVDQDNVVPNHVYMVDKVEVRDGQKMIHVLNPWGPDGGTGGDGKQKSGDLWLTEQQYRDNFDGAQSVQGKKK